MFIVWPVSPMHSGIAGVGAAKALILIIRTPDRPDPSMQYRRYENIGNGSPGLAPLQLDPFNRKFPL